MIRRPALGAAFLTLAMAGAAAADCMVFMTEAGVEGRLTRGRFQDAAGRREIAFILELQRPVCLTGADEEDRVAGTTRVHVFSIDDRLRRALAQAVGKTVRVTGKPFGAITAHHHAPIVIDVSAVTPK